MVTVGVPTGFSSSAALKLIETLQTVSSDNARFLRANMSSISAHVRSTLSAGAMFSILGAVAASRQQMGSVVEQDAAQEVGQEDQRTGVSDDLLMQFGATATAVMRTEGAEASGGALPGGGAAQVSVTTVSLHFAGRQQVEADSTAAYVYRYAQNYVRDNALSSKDISDILYGGGSIGDASMQGVRSFADVVRQLYGFAEGDTAAASSVAAWLADGRPSSPMVHFDGQSDDQVVDFISGMDRSAESFDRQASAMTAAFDRHALTFEKASEVEGLDYTETVRANAFVGRSGIGVSSEMNQDFMEQDADGKQHTLIRVGDVELYATW
jgi:hypothetical protein